MNSKNTKPKTQLTDSKIYYYSSFFSPFVEKKNQTDTKCQNGSANSAAIAISQAQQVDNQMLDEMMPEIDQLRPVKSILWDYSFDGDAEWLKKPFVFFGISSLQKQILALSYCAAPFDEIEKFIRKAYVKKESHLSATLVRATTEAIKNLDVTFRGENGEEIIAEGMAEKLIKLHEELLPDTYQKSLKQIKDTLQLEDEKEQAAREEANFALMNQVCNAIKQNDQNTDVEIENFNNVVRQTTPLNLLHLLFAAFMALLGEDSISEVINDEKFDRERSQEFQVYDRFCLEIIGIAIERNLPPRMQKIIEIGVANIFQRTRAVERKLDVDGEAFIGIRDFNRELGINFCYDARGNKARSVSISSILGCGYFGVLSHQITSTLRTYRVR